MKRVWRWLWRGTLGVLLVSLVIVGAVLIAAHTDWGREQLRLRVERALVETFPGGVTIGRIDGSVLGELIARDVEARDHEGTPVANVGTIRIRVALLPLFRSTARIESLVVEDVVARVHATKTPPPREPPEEPSSWSLELVDVSVRRARVVIETGQEPITIEDVEVAASGGLRAGELLRAGVWLRGTWRERAAPITAAVFVRAGEPTSVPLAHVRVGGVSLLASEVVVDPERPTGRVIVDGRAQDVARLVPASVPVLGDLVLALTATGDGGETHVALAGRVGQGRIDGAIAGDLATRTARAVIAGTDVELAPVSRGAVRGRGTAVLAGTVAQRARELVARGAVIVRGTVEQAPAGAAVIGFDARGTDTGILAGAADAFVIAGADGATYVAAVGRVTGTLVEGRARGELVRGVVGAGTQDPRGASAGRAPVRGVVALEATARGPFDALEVGGDARLSRIRYEDLSVTRARARFEGTITAMPTGRMQLVLEGAARSGEPLGRATADVRLRADRRLAVTARASPADVPVVVDADALVTLGDVIDIALGSHRVRTAATTWTGRGGTVRIADKWIRIARLRSASGEGRVELAATIGRGTSALAVALTATDVPAQAIEPAARGTLSGAVAIERRGARWSGGGTVTGRRLARGSDERQLDGEVSLTLDGRRVTVSGKASSPELGGARVALEVEGPRDLTDVDAWRRITRGDLHAVVIGLDSLQPRALTKGRVPGVFDGTLEIREGVPDGVIRVRGVPTKLGTAGADITLALDTPGFVDVRADAHVGALAEAKVDARLHIPERPFDPAVWQRLGRHVIAGAHVRTNEVVIDPRVLALLGIDAPYRARARAEVTVQTGGDRVEATVELADVKGGPIVTGLAATVTAHTDGTDTQAGVHVHLGGRTLARIADVRTPVTLARWLADAEAALAEPVAGTLTIPDQQVAPVLGVFGRAGDVQRGRLSGTGTLGGVIRKPTGSVAIALADVAVTPRLTRRPPPVLTALGVAATWDGAVGSVEVTGSEAPGKDTPGGTLAVSARGRPDELHAVVANAELVNWELAPVAVFLPGVLAGMSGRLDTDLESLGVDPATAMVRGTLALKGGRMPLAPAIGTLRSANATIELKDTGITARLDGAIGAGTITASAVSGPDSKQASVTAKLTNVSPIGALEPRIDANVRGTVRREERRIVGDVTIFGAVARIPEQSGQPLHDANAPTDLYFVDLPLPELKKSRAPERPWLVVDVTLEPARIEAKRYLVVSSLLATASGNVEVSVGETVGLDGRVRVERGNADLFGHRYRVETGEVVFDGTTDARVDLALSTEFPDVTMFVRFAGRLSELAYLEPELTSDPGVYSRGQLLGFLLGGTPGGDPGRQAGEAVLGLGSSLGSQQVKRLAERLLPSKLEPLAPDVARCAPRPGDNVLTCTVGKWVTDTLFFSYDYQNQPRHDETTGNAKLEWHFKRDWTLETAGDSDYLGGDLTWRRRW